MVEDTDGLRLEKISFTIGNFSLKDISFSVREGEYFVLTGPNGAGKTILIKLIAGLYQPAEGEIYIQGKKITTTPPWERNIGYVPQEGVLFPKRTVERNISFGLEIKKLSPQQIKKAVAEIGEMMQITHLFSRSPEGLSGGEKQKVSLARALILKPALLLLDEPVSAIDEKTRNSLCQEIQSLQKYFKITTIHISHNQEETNQVAERIGVLNQGKLKEIRRRNEQS
jgi:ABC-type sugar transport system ATPase subunit